jgi:hypothetical protein
MPNKTVTFGGIHIARIYMPQTNLPQILNTHSNKGATSSQDVPIQNSRRRRRNERGKARGRKRVLTKNENNHQMLMDEETMTKSEEELTKGIPR